MKRALLFACLVATPASKQDPPPAFRSRVEMVTIPCTVVDENAVVIRVLPPDEFRIFQNGARRTVKNSWIDTDLPLTLGVLIDASASQEQQVAEHRRTAL